MPAKKKTAARRTRRQRTTPATPEQTRLWLMYPAKLIQEPIIWKLGQKFKVITNIRQVSVTDEIGITCLELDGQRQEIKRAIKWLEKLGINVEPVEIGVIES
jgi:ABC-type methionine transport system ATPase subunit